MGFDTVRPPASAFVAAVEHHGRGLLYRGSARDDGPSGRPEIFNNEDGIGLKSHLRHQPPDPLAPATCPYWRRCRAICRLPCHCVWRNCALITRMRASLSELSPSEDAQNADRLVACSATFALNSALTLSAFQLLDLSFSPSRIKRSSLSGFRGPSHSSVASRQLDVGRRDQPHFMVEILDQPAQVGCAGAGFHRDGAARLLGEEASTWWRRSFLRKTTAPSAAAPCAWNTFFARSPITGRPRRWSSRCR